MKFTEVLTHYLINFDESKINDSVVYMANRIRLFLCGIDGGGKKKLLRLKVIAKNNSIQKEDAELIKLAVLFHSVCHGIEKDVKPKNQGNIGFFGHINESYCKDVKVSYVNMFNTGTTFVTKFKLGEHTLTWFSTFDIRDSWRINVNDNVTIEFDVCDHKVYRGNNDNIITRVSRRAVL